MNKIRYFIFLTVLIGLSSCGQKTDKTKARPPVVVDVIIAESVNLPTTIEVNGSALSNEMVSLHPETSGRITYLNIPDGAFVTEGTVLAQINDAELQAELEQQKVSIELAMKTEQRLKKLLEVKGVNQSDYDAALNHVNTINAMMNIINAQIDKTIVKAPFSGTLGLRMVSPGAYVTPQTELGTLQQTDNIKIDFTVPETYADLIGVGNTVYIETNSSGEKQTAIITAIEPQISVETRNMKVRARLEKGTINPGTFVKVILFKDEKGIIVPSNCIIPDANSNQVIVIKNKKAAFVNVETGIRNADAVELASGVKPGDTVIVSGILFVRPNSVLKIRNIGSKETMNKQESKPISQ
jgi:membrane fusion protein (multidrug efflux system)